VIACASCGEPFEPLRRSDAKTCSIRCRVARFRAVRAAGTCYIGPDVPEAVSASSLPSTVSGDVLSEVA
jgi:hypothetical protein